LDVDTGGVAATVTLEGDNRIVLQTLTVTTTYTDRHRNIPLQHNLISNHFRLVITPGTGGKFKLWNYVVDYIALPAKVNYIHTIEQDFGVERWKWLKEAWIHYSATAPVTLNVYVDGGSLFFTQILPIQADRDVYRFFFPAVTTVLNKSKCYSFEFTSSTGFYLFADSRIDWQIWNSDQRGSFNGFNVSGELQQPVAQPALG
jgi:hypothetical protein